MIHESCFGAEDTPLNSLLSYPIDGPSSDYTNSEESVVDESDIDDYVDIIKDLSDRDLERQFDDAFLQDFNRTIPPITVPTKIIPTTYESEVNENMSSETKKDEQKEDCGKQAAAIKRSKHQRKPKSKRATRNNKKRNQDGRANRSIHLWEFILELLNDDSSNYIQWISKQNGTFRLMNSSAVARLWGERKNRKNMTYEKMSRALRYYYEKHILERVPNARLIYKFGERTRASIAESSEDSHSDISEN